MIECDIIYDIIIKNFLILVELIVLYNYSSIINSLILKDIYICNNSSLINPGGGYNVLVTIKLIDRRFYKIRH